MNLKQNIALMILASTWCQLTFACLGFIAFLGDYTRGVGFLFYFK